MADEMSSVSLLQNQSGEHDFQLLFVRFEDDMYLMVVLDTVTKRFYCGPCSDRGTWDETSGVEFSADAVPWLAPDIVRAAISDSIRRHLGIQRTGGKAS